MGQATHLHVTGNPCCYLPDTYFKVVTAGGEILAPAKMLFKGAQVVAANGTPVEVVQPPEQHRVDAVIELKADQSFLVVSPDHRILIPGNKTVLGQSCKGCEAHVCMLRFVWYRLFKCFPLPSPRKSCELLSELHVSL